MNWTCLTAKKAGKKPRPLKVGEVLRSLAARHILTKNEKQLRRKTVKKNQKLQNLNL